MVSASNTSCPSSVKFAVNWHHFFRDNWDDEPTRNALTIGCFNIIYQDDT